MEFGRYLLRKIESSYHRADRSEPDVPEDIRMLYHASTLRQICYLREYLFRKEACELASERSFMIGGALAGIMHGSFRRDGTSQYFEY